MWHIVHAERYLHLEHYGEFGLREHHLQRLGAGAIAAPFGVDGKVLDVDEGVEVPVRHQPDGALVFLDEAAVEQGVAVGVGPLQVGIAALLRGEGRFEQSLHEGIMLMVGLYL